MPFIVRDKILGICPICEEEQQIEIGRQIETLNIRGKSVKIDAHVKRCTVCTEVFATTEQEEKNIQEAYRQYRQEAKLLQPEEIRVIREKYGLSQKAFAGLLGWGEITLHRYESGALQDEVHNNLLLLLDKPDNFSTIFEKNKNRLTSKQVQKVQERLSKFLVVTMTTSTFTAPRPLVFPPNENEWEKYTREIFFQQSKNGTEAKPSTETEDSPELAFAA